MKSVLIDADGVVICFKKNFAECYSERFNVPIEEILKFFETDYHSCAVGKADIREVIKEYIPRWKWVGSVEGLLDFWYSCQSEVNQSVLESVAKARAHNVPVYLAADQDRVRAKHLLDQVGLRSRFDGFFFSCDVGFTKADARFFQRATTILGCSPGDLLFLDDSRRNVETALGVGLVAELYVNNERLQETISAFCAA
jgi:putative hydrolase of the HAD superfamily